MTIPQEFIGKFTVERSENFEDYLKARGIGIVARKLAITVLGKMTKVFTDNGDGSYTLENLSPKKNMSWRFKLNEQIETEGFDDKMHKITFHIDNGDIIEDHIVDGESEPPVRYKMEGGYMVAHLQAGDVKCQRYFKRQ